MTERTAALAAVGQGAFWLAAGGWPLLHYRSFEAVTGPKKDTWLVRTMGALIAVVGGTLLLAGVRRQVDPAVAFLGGVSAAALGGADVLLVAKGRVSPIYLLDALAEAPFVAAWAALAARRAGARAASPPARRFG